MPAVEGPKAKKIGLSILAKKPSVGPNAPISITATMMTVTLPSMTGARPRSKPARMAPSMLLPERISSLMRSAAMTLASTPIPMARMMPAMPGSVSVKLLSTEK